MKSNNSVVTLIFGFIYQSSPIGLGSQISQINRFCFFYLFVLERGIFCVNICTPIIKDCWLKIRSQISYFRSKINVTNSLRKVHKKHQCFNLNRKIWDLIFRKNWMVPIQDIKWKRLSKHPKCESAALTFESNSVCLVPLNRV